MDKRSKFQQLAAEMPVLHCHGKYNAMLAVEVLEWLLNHVQEGMNTLETGSGYSTIVFAMAGARHRAVTPAPHEFEAISNWCSGHEVSLENVTFVNQSSDEYLPTLRPDDALDGVLVDGSHAFPAPFVDWHYASKVMKPGGFVVLDDIQIRNIGLLAEFLRSDTPRWQLVHEVPRRAAIFKKLPWDRWIDWYHQPFNLNSRWARKTARSALANE